MDSKIHHTFIERVSTSLHGSVPAIQDHPLSKEDLWRPLSARGPKTPRGRCAQWSDGMGVGMAIPYMVGAGIVWGWDIWPFGDHLLHRNGVVQQWYDPGLHGYGSRISIPTINFRVHSCDPQPSNHHLDHWYFRIAFKTCDTWATANQ